MLIGSIGSCFAREIKTWLVENGYRYLQAATGACTEAGSARYDRVYSTFSILQEFERAYGCFEPAEDVWNYEDDGVELFLDPYRKNVAWESLEEKKRELAQHKREHLRA